MDRIINTIIDISQNIVKNYHFVDVKKCLQGCVKNKKITVQQEKGCAIIEQQLNKTTLTKDEKLYFLANVFHECAYLTRLEENLNYTSTKRLKQVFPSFFKDKDENFISQFLRQPEKLANFVYGGRFGNGKDEGYKYRGRGLLMLTFKDNYIRYDVHNYALLTDINYSCQVCLKYYIDKCNKSNIKTVRKGIAGSLFGIKEVEEIYGIIKKIK